VPLRKIEGSCRQPVERTVEQAEGAPRADRHRGVEHVLAGAAPVDPGSRRGVPRSDRFSQPLHQWNREAAGVRAGADERVEVVCIDPARRRDRGCCAIRYHTLRSFGAGESSLEIEHRLHERTRFEHLEDLGGRQEAVEERCGHGRRVMQRRGGDAGRC
jgi:hypothetical protein